MIYALALIPIVLIYLSTCTLVLHPRPRKDLLFKPYTQYPDVRIKTEGNKNIVIALHGMYSHPDTFKELGERIAPLGWDLFAPVLPNSARSSEDLRSQEIYQWEELLQAAFHRAVLSVEGYEKVVLLGHSQGGALALTLAPSLGFLSGLAIVAAPLHMAHPKKPFVRTLGLRFSGLLHFLIPKHGMKTDKISPEVRKELAKIEDTVGGDGYFFGLTLHSMSLGLRKMRRRLHLITHPLFLAYEKNDGTVSFKDYLELKTKVGSKNISECITETPESLHPYAKKHRLFSYVAVKESLYKALGQFLRDRA